MTRNSQEHVFTAGSLSRSQHYPAINETGVKADPGSPATTRQHRGDLQWADPPKPLLLQQLV